MERWQNFNSNIFDTLLCGGNPSPYFSVIFLSNAGMLSKNMCHDIVTTSAAWPVITRISFLIKSRSVALNTTIVESIHNLFELINKHYGLSEDDGLRVYLTEDETYLEVCCGPWWQKNLMRKMLFFKLIRFAFFYQGKYKADSLEDIENTITKIVTHFSNEILGIDYKGGSYKLGENNIVANNVSMVIENILWSHKIKEKAVCTRHGFLTYSAIPLINNYIKDKKLNE